ncbi:MAG: hypothetical protein JWP95_1957 [Actinotalea sp.]|nr:hypothetical protein [Actinotalea sp.]
MARSLDDRMVEVELLDGPDAAEADVTDPTTVAAPTRGGTHGATLSRAEDLVAGPPDDRVARGPRRRGVFHACVLVVVLAVVVSANLGEQASQERRDAALAAMPGIVPPIAGPLEALWEHPAGRGSVVVDDVLLTEDPVERPSVYGAVDLATGRALWEVRRGPGGLVEWCGGALVGDGVRTALCWGAGTVVDPATGDSVPAPATIMGLSLADGSVVFSRAMDVPSAGYGTIGTDLVAGDLEGRILTVRRLDPVTGEERWTVGVPLEVPGADGMSRAFVEVSHGFVVVRGPTAVVLSADDGAELGRWNARVDTSGQLWDLSGASISTSDRGFGVWTEVSDTSATGRGAWFDRDGHEVLEISGTAVEPRVTDGSTPEVLLVAPHLGTEVEGVDLTTGETLWSVDLRGGRVLMRRDGAVVLSDGRQVASIDLRTGHERWARDVEGLRPDAGSVTDGHRVVVVAVRDGVWVLEAVDLDTGDVAWTQAAPKSSVLAEFVVPGADGVALGEVAGQVLTIRQRSVLGLG